MLADGDEEQTRPSGTGGGAGRRGRATRSRDCHWLTARFIHRLGGFRGLNHRGVCGRLLPFRDWGINLGQCKCTRAVWADSREPRGKKTTPRHINATRQPTIRASRTGEAQSQPSRNPDPARGARFRRATSSWNSLRVTGCNSGGAPPSWRRRLAQARSILSMSCSSGIYC